MMARCSEVLQVASGHVKILGRLAGHFAAAMLVVSSCLAIDVQVASAENAPLVYTNLAAAGGSLGWGMDLFYNAHVNNCLTDDQQKQRDILIKRAARLSDEIDLQLRSENNRATLDKLFLDGRLNESNVPAHHDFSRSPAPHEDTMLAPRNFLLRMKEGLRKLAELLDTLPPCVPEVEDFDRKEQSNVAPGGRAVGGGFFERTGIQAYVGLEIGGGAAKARYDELVIDPRSFAAGAFAGVRLPQPGNWFIGGQVGFLATDLTREASPGFQVGLRYGWTLDAQVGTTMRTPLSAQPVTFYAFAGPMIGITRTVSAGATDHFTLFGVTAGVGTEVNVTQSWAVGAKVRWFNLGPGNAKSEGQHVDGVIGTIGAMHRF